eukprot:14080616-Alexandrium_andersonii.AAC.1
MSFANAPSGRLNKKLGIRQEVETPSRTGPSPWCAALRARLASSAPAANDCVGLRIGGLWIG